MNSEEPKPPTRQDADDLRARVEEAVAAIPEVREANGYPIYPPAFEALTRYITHSPWHRFDYTVDMKKRLDDRIDELTLGEVRSYLTFLCRVDRFSPGGLLGILEGGLATRVAERAGELVAAG